MNLDSVEITNAGAGQVHLERAADLLRDLAHQLDLAGICSELCAVPAAMGPIGKLAWAIAAAHQDTKMKLAKNMPAERPRLRVVK